MKSSSGSVRSWGTRVFVVMLLAGLFTVPVASVSAAANGTRPSTNTTRPKTITAW